MRPLSSSRMTMPSPWIIGMIDTRTSISRPWTRILMRPSCGSRFSAMLSRAMILMRLMIAVWKRLISGGSVLLLEQAVDAVADAEAVLLGSTWMSLARSLAASMRISLTSLTTDASWAILASLAVVGLEVFEQLELVVAALPATRAATVSPPTPKCVLDEPGDLARAGQHRHGRAGR